MTNTESVWQRLTETQRRRVKLYLTGFSQRQIAATEGVTQRAIWDSLTSAYQKIPSLRTVVYDWQRL